MKNKGKLIFDIISVAVFTFLIILIPGFSYHMIKYHNSSNFILTGVIILLALGIFIQRYKWITMQKRSAEKLMESAEAERKSNEVKRRFLSVVSHDMRAPLNAIIGTAELALTHTTDKDDRKSYNSIISSGRMLSRLANDLLEVSRIENGRLKAVPEKVNLKDMMNVVLSEVKRDAEDKNLTVRLNTNGLRHECAVTDGMRAGQIYTNLLTNAVKYTGNGGKIVMHLWDEFKEECSDFQVCFRIKDNGIGMSREFMSHMYDAFERENAPLENTVHGFGIGLYIVKTMTELLGGSIECHSTEGKGTCFTVRLPASESAGNVQPADDGKHDTAGSLDGMKILVADDMELNRRLVAEYAGAYGIKCEHAVNGRDCLEHIENSPAGTYDAVLMDVNMPVLNGVEATRNIRSIKDDIKSITPVIALTGEDGQESINECMKAGMNGYISKPVDFKILTGILKDIYCKCAD